MWFMVTVAQLVEPRIVTPVVGGSNPLSHPIRSTEKPPGTPRRLFRMWPADPRAKPPGYVGIPGGFDYNLRP